VFGIERHTAEFMAVDLQHLDATGPDLDQIVTSAVNGLGGDLIGAEHPSTLTSMNNLAFTWKWQGRVAEAIKLMEECVQLRTLVLGGGHSDTLSSFTALIGWVSYAQRPLTSQELCYALAIEPGDMELDGDNAYDVEDIISVCAGLVTIDEERVESGSFDDKLVVMILKFLSPKTFWTAPTP